MYKFIIFLMFVSFLTSSCDVPRNRSSLYDATYSDRTTNSSSSASSFYTSTTTVDKNTTSKDTTTTTPSPATTVPSSYSHCVNSSNTFPSTSNYLGNYFICQSQTDKNKIYFWPQNTQNTKICLIPMYSNGGSSINLGNAQCQYISSTNSGVEFTLYKNRAGFENYIINAVMIMKDDAAVYPYPYSLKYGSTAIADTTAFYLCMDTAYQTSAYCQAFSSLKRYQMHIF